ncbi:MAG TPA: glycosyltransferase family 39 protein [Candidatus Limnocylindrales bacterium]|nr:glycosyltransferase family 39 protein [Candidatus Limnocylindrales bacterium]
MQTIVRDGQLVLPMRNGNELPSKPPLFHWLGALASFLHGRVSEGTIRFPSLVAALLAALATALAAWSWWGADTALMTAVVLGTSYQWLASSVTARVDMVLAAAVTLALLSFARAIETGRSIPVTVFVLLVVATLTKGPIGLVLPCTIAGVTLALRGELAFLGMREARLLLLAIAASSAWYVAAFFVGGDAFFAKQILKENVFRVLDPDSVEAGHVAPFWFYVPLMAAGLAPWSLFIPGLVAFAVTRPTGADTMTDGAGAAVRVVASSAAPTTTAAATQAATTVAAAPTPSLLRRLDPHVVFAVVWGAVTFGIFSLAGSKRAVYLLPAYPAYAMLIARAWTSVMRSRTAPVAAALFVAGAVLSAALLVAVAIVVVAGAAGVPIDGRLAQFVSNADVNNVTPVLEATREHRAIIIPLGLVMLSAAWVTVRSAQGQRWARVAAATALAMIVLQATLSTTLLPALASKRSARSFINHVQELVPVEVPLSFYRAFDYGAVFYRGAPIPVRQALTDVPEIDGAWLLTWPAFLSDLSEEVRKLDTGGEAAGAYEVEEAIASKDVDPSDRTSLVLVRIKRRIPEDQTGDRTDERSGDRN